MAMPAVHTGPWTAEQVRALPDDGNRYELIDGELLVSPSPSLMHQRAVTGLWRALDAFCREHRLGEVFVSPADPEFAAGQVVQPDVFVVPRHDHTPLKSWADVRNLLLVIEVLSPSTARYDRVVKRRLYQREGVEYWVVDAAARVVERWRPADARPEVCDGILEWHAGSHAPTLTLDLVSIFGEVHGEGG